MAHRAHMAHLIDKNTYGFDLSLSKQQIEYSREASKHRFPLNGLTLEFRNFGNVDFGLLNVLRNAKPHP